MVTALLNSLVALAALAGSLGPARGPQDRGAGHYLIQWRNNEVVLDFRKARESMDLDGFVAVRRLRTKTFLARKKLFDGAADVHYWGYFDDGRRLVVYMKVERVLESFTVDQRGRLRVLPLNGPWAGGASLRIATPHDVYLVVYPLAGAAPSRIPRHALGVDNTYYVHWDARQANWKVVDRIGKL